MHRVVAVTICSLLAVWAELAAQPSSQDAPDRSIVIIGPHLPVSTLKELWDRTAVVVLATVQKTLPPQIERSRTVFRYQILDIGEVLKDEAGSVPSSHRIKVKQYGGTVRVGGRKFITNYIAPPVPDGEEAILFLSPLTTENAFQVPYGDTGTFPIDQMTGTIPINSYEARGMPEIGGRDRMDKRELMAALRSLAAARN